METTNYKSEAGIAQEIDSTENGCPIQQSTEEAHQEHKYNRRTHFIVPSVRIEDYSDTMTSSDATELEALKGSDSSSETRHQQETEDKQSLHSNDSEPLRVYPGIVLSPNTSEEKVTEGMQDEEAEPPQDEDNRPQSTGSQSSLPVPLTKSESVEKFSESPSLRAAVAEHEKEENSTENNNKGHADENIEVDETRKHVDPDQTDELQDIEAEDTTAEESKKSQLDLQQNQKTNSQENNNDKKEDKELQNDGTKTESEEPRSQMFNIQPLGSQSSHLNSTTSSTFLRENSAQEIMCPGRNRHSSVSSRESLEDQNEMNRKRKTNDKPNKNAKAAVRRKNQSRNSRQTQERVPQKYSLQSEDSSEEENNNKLQQQNKFKDRLFSINYIYDADGKTVKRASTGVSTMRSGDTSARKEEEQRKKKDAQSEELKHQILKLKRELKKFGAKIDKKKPKCRKHCPYIFNNLGPYRTADMGAFNDEGDRRHRFVTRMTAQTILDPWEDLKMDNTILPVPSPKPQTQHRQKTAVSSKSSVSSVRPAIHSSGMRPIRQPRFPRVRVDYKAGVFDNLCQNDVPYLRKEITENLLHSSKQRVSDDYKHMKEDFYNLQLDRLSDIPDPVARSNIKRAYLAYLQNSPGSARAVKECLEQALDD